MARPAPRIAVVALPIVVALIVFRPRNAPKIVAPTEIATLQLTASGFRLLPLDHLLRAPDTILEGCNLGRILFPQGVRFADHCSRPAWSRTRKSRSDSPGRDKAFALRAAKGSSVCVR